VAARAEAQIPQGAGSDPAADLEAQYRAVLAAMKSPVATGVLVTEIGPLSAAGHAGCGAGTSSPVTGGHEARTLAALRTEVAEALAWREVEITSTSC